MAPLIRVSYLAMITLFVSFFLLFSCSADTELFDEENYIDESAEIGQYSSSEEEEGEEAEEENTEAETEQSETQEEEPQNEETSQEQPADPPQDDYLAFNPNNTYYVTTTGSPSNDGRSEASAWSLLHAFNTAQSGDLVYVKAGNYGNTTPSVANSGTSSMPIAFVGYVNTPGDIVSNGESTFTYSDYKNNNNEVNPNTMPTIMGANEYFTDPDAHAGITINRDYIILMNFQVTRRNNGIYLRGNHAILKNVVCVNNGSNVGAGGYQGKGFGIKSNGADYAIIENSIIINTGLLGLSLIGSDYHRHWNNKVYSDNAVNPCDYYYFLTGDSQHNVIRNAHVERVGYLSHPGHGLGAKQASKYNEFYDSEVINTNIEIQYAGTTNNLFKRCNITGNLPYEQGAFNNSIYVSSGANNNVFEDFRITNANGIFFLDYDNNDTSQYGYLDQVDAGHNNVFRNGIVENSQHGILFHFFNQTGAVAYDNVFENMTFRNLVFLFAVDRDNYGNRMVNCKIENVQALSTTKYPGQYPLNFDYGNATFSGNGFQNPN